MSKYQLAVQNDNGNSEHKIFVDGTMYRHPNVYAVITNGLSEADGEIGAAVENLHKKIDVRIESPAVGPGSKRYLIGDVVIDTKGDYTVENMNVRDVQKHTEILPVINTLGILAVASVKKHYKEKGSITDKETITVEVDMITALPAGTHNAKSDAEFTSKFAEHVHEVKVYVKHLTVNVQIKFVQVKTLKEGVPAMFSIISTLDGNYRNDDLFAKFEAEYGEVLKEEGVESVDGSYFADKKILHFDIGDGSSETVYTQGYAADSGKSDGLGIGLGKAIEEAVKAWSVNESETITRQEISKYLKGIGKKFLIQKAHHYLDEAKANLVDELLAGLEAKLKQLRYDVDVIAVYGGASILLEKNLYVPIKEMCEKYEMKMLYIPAPYAVTMNAEGMVIYHNLVKQQAEAAATEEE